MKRDPLAEIREIRERISLEISKMTNEEMFAYFHEAAERVEKQIEEFRRQREVENKKG
jgi:hypothetical protein